MVGRGGLVSTKDFERISAPARRFVGGDDARLVIVVDDLERARRDQHRAVFARYRVALDRGMGPHYTRGSVHFLANMLEAYYFADAAALRVVLGLEIADHEGDVEAIGHPKHQLKGLAPGFDEVHDGAKVVASLRLEHVLANFSTCASLRSLFAWCVRKTGQPVGDRFCLSTGARDLVTGPQLGHDLRSLA